MVRYPWLLFKNSALVLPTPGVQQGNTRRLKWSCEAGGSPDEARSEQTPYPFHAQLILVLFGHKITLYRFNQGGSYYCRGSNRSRGVGPLTLTTGSTLCQRKRPAARVLGLHGDYTPTWGGFHLALSQAWTTSHGNAVIKEQSKRTNP